MTHIVRVYEVTEDEYDNGLVIERTFESDVNAEAWIEMSMSQGYVRDTTDAGTFIYPMQQIRRFTIRKEGE